MYTINNIYLEHHSKENIESWLKSTGFYYAFILHDKDIKENGETKKPHYHIMIDYQDGGTHTKSTLTTLVKKTLDKDAFIDTIRNITKMSRYLRHLDNKEKAQYTIKEVITSNLECYLNLCEIKSPLKKDKENMEEILQEMIEKIDKYEIINGYDAFNYFLDKNKLSYFINHRNALLSFIEDRIDKVNRWNKNKD